MKQEKIYASAVAFRQALEERLLTISREQNVPLERLRKRIAFDRLLARLFDKKMRPMPQWLLKGGYALEIRHSNIARATKDIDMAIPDMAGPSPETVRGLLQHSTERDGGDWFSFLIGAYSQELHQPVYGGWRYPVEARLANKIFTKFNIDVAVGDAVVSEAEWRKGTEMLSFAGIPPAEVALFPRDQQFAEKAHSFTFPRSEKERSRVKDLVDMVLLIENGMPRSSQVIKAIKATFERRKTHSIPDSLVLPPASWEPIYREMALDCGVTCKTVGEAFKLLSSYWRKLFKKR